LGTMLLQGWTMLAESCPIGCNVPLIELKPKKTILCASCDRKFVRKGDIFEPLDSVPLKSEEIPSGAQVRKRAEENTPVAPPQDKKLKDEEREKMYEEKRRRTDQVSKKLGDKLLMGWTLLGEVCPSCGAPLMRDHAKKMHCLSCDTLVITNAEFDPNKHQVIPPGQKSLPIPPKVQPKVDEHVRGEEEDEEEDEDEEEGEENNTRRNNNSGSSKGVGQIPDDLLISLIRETDSSLITRINNNNNNNSKIKPSEVVESKETTHAARQSAPIFSHPQHDEIWQNSQETLFQTLSRCSKELATAKSVEESTRLCILMKECVGAISAMQNLIH